MLFADFITQATTLLVASLSQLETNGLSLWGTLDVPQLPLYNSTNAPQTSLQNTYGAIPNTGRTVYYDWTISRGYIAPDGVNKSVILINGQFPGPLLDANWGDMIQVTVRNYIKDEGTTIHWHGLLQSGTPWMDGVPGISQCPISPGSQFTYRFRADQYGTSWYHSHYSGQYGAGLFGPLVIYGPQNVHYDVDIGPVMLHDWYHADYYQVVERLFSVPANPLAANNNLINGKMDFNCSAITVNASCTANAGLSKFQFYPGKTHRLRLINPGTEGNQKFSIDGHVLTVIAVDFVPVVPYDTNVVTIGVGQRTDVIVKAIGKVGSSYWMRSNFSQLCASSPSLQPNALAVVLYDGANPNSRPNSTPFPYNETNCLNDPLNTTTPYVKSSPPVTPQVTQTIDINYVINGSGMFLFTFGGSSFRADYNQPVLLTAATATTSTSNSSIYTNSTSLYPTTMNVHDFGTPASVRLIITNSVPVSHPMHLHGHNFWILAEGVGTWDGTITNPSNPIRRDTFMMAAALRTGSKAYTVIEYVADNPGVWPFHCHVSGHVSTGLLINVLEQPNMLANNSQALKSISPTCESWQKWTKSHLVDEIDSGE
ncbi:hypothetical protein BPAE_0152g00250 [Botrytis paeoniae]|uniref:laccase n=1 Tax=Botrytis paeoniae TaxID=278948 RepID=A0A4Z1FH28_9HELO|nr:hypothetical protein BPAE_0152g00250 [Botrytis paeoniae]